jgi:hypothetical protein
MFAIPGFHYASYILLLYGCIDLLELDKDI